MSPICLANVKIAGLACAVPKNERTNKDFEGIFATEEIASVSKMTGVKTRRVTDGGTCTSDLCEAAATALMQDLGWSSDSIDALMFVSQTPDYVLPPSSSILQARLGLTKSTAAFDVNLGCSGYVYGLWMAASLVASRAVKRVLLLVGDTCTKFVSPHDRATALLFGDAGSATALEFCESTPELTFVLGTNGAGAQNLIIPAGGFRNRSTPETLKRVPREDGSLRSDEDLYMNGGEIFNFTLETVAPMVRQTIDAMGWQMEDVDYFVFHQANAFIIKHIAKKLKLSPEQVPLSIERFGNTSSASIPLTLVNNASDRLTSTSARVIAAGFGVGYSWGAVAMSLGPLSCVRLVEV